MITQTSQHAPGLGMSVGISDGDFVGKDALGEGLGSLVGSADVGIGDGCSEGESVVGDPVGSEVTGDFDGPKFINEN